MWHVWPEGNQRPQPQGPVLTHPTGGAQGKLGQNPLAAPGWDWKVPHRKHLPNQLLSCKCNTRLRPEGHGWVYNAPQDREPSPPSRRAFRWPASDPHVFHQRSLCGWACLKAESCAGQTGTLGCSEPWEVPSKGLEVVNPAKRRATAQCSLLSLVRRQTSAAKMISPGPCSPSLRRGHSSSCAALNATACPWHTSLIPPGINRI